MAVVMPDEVGEYAFEVPASEDQDPVEAFATHGADRAFGVSVHYRDADRSLDDLDAFGAEDLVEGRPMHLAS